MMPTFHPDWPPMLVTEFGIVTESILLPEKAPDAMDVMLEGMFRDTI